MFQCPNCRAYTDLSAEVDDTNDFDEEDEKKDTPEDKQDTTDASRSQTNSPQLEAQPAPSGDEPRQDNLPAEAGLAANIESMRLQDTDASDDARRPRAPTSNNDAAPANADNEVPGWQSVTQSPNALQTRQSHLRADTPVRSESSDDNPLTPLNDSGPLALDGRAAMP